MNTDQPPENRQQELAERRTETAFQRTLLAEERTYSAWIRTGLAATVTGFAIAKFMGETGPMWLVHAMATLFILSGAAMFVLAFWAYHRALRALLGLQHVPSGRIPLWILVVLSAGMTVASAAGLFLVYQQP